MLDNFPDDPCYFVNVSREGEYHLYDMRWIATTRSNYANAKMWNGGYEKKRFYFFPKDMFMINLATGEYGKGSLVNETFGRA